MGLLSKATRQELAGEKLFMGKRRCAECRIPAGLKVERSGEKELTAKGMAFLVAGQAETWSPTKTSEVSSRSAPDLSNRYQQWRAAMQTADETPTN